MLGEDMDLVLSTYNDGSVLTSEGSCTHTVHTHTLRSTQLANKRKKRNGTFSLWLSEI